MQKQSFFDRSIKNLEFTFDKQFPIIPTWGLHTVDDKKESLHYHNGLELGYCYSGSGVFFVNNKILPFSREDVSVIFINEAHIAQSHKGDLSKWKFVTVDVEALLTSLGIENIEKISKIMHGSDTFINIIKKNEDPVFNLLVYHLILEIEEKKEGYQEMVKSYIWTIMNKLTRIVVPSKEKTITNTFTRFRGIKTISPALNFLSKNYFEDIKVKQLAGLCTISIPHFRRVFKDAMNCSPLEYLYQIRIKIAANLLEHQTFSIMEIAMQVGYSSITSFNRHFKRIKGVTPKEWRGKALV